MRVTKAICEDCADKTGVEFLLLSPEVVIGECYICGAKYNLVHYKILKKLNEWS